MTRILIADDHDVVRSGLRSILETHPNWQVVAEAADGKEAILKAIETKPHVAVIDYMLPIVNGVEVSIEGNDIMQLTLTDGNPNGGGTLDTLAISIQRSKGGLWYSSGWDGTKTVEKPIADGVLSVH